MTYPNWLIRSVGARDLGLGIGMLVIALDLRLVAARGVSARSATVVGGTP